MSGADGPADLPVEVFPAEGAQVTPCPGGPALLRGATHVTDAAQATHPVNRPVVAVCRCGASGRLPWCDGTHKVAVTPSSPGRTLGERSRDHLATPASEGEERTMSENTHSVEEQDAAQEAAQNVVDEVTSWEYSGDSERIDEKLDEGLSEAGVEVSAQEKDRIVEEIDDVKKDESGGTPEVGTASPAE